MATSTDLRSAIEEVQGQLPADQAAAEEPLVVGEADWTTRLSRRVGALPWWVISAATHAVVFLLVALLATAVAPPVNDEVVIATDVVKQKPPEYDPQKKRDIFKNTKEVQSDTVVENPVVTHEKVEESDHFETDNNMDRNSARGSEDAISDLPFGGTGTVGSIGVGGGGMAGCFGYRDGGGRKKAVGRFGGSQATESAVEAALRWLARHQNADGSWSLLQDKGKKPNISMTGLATLAFLGAGHTHKTGGPFTDNVARGVKWILSQQQDNGAIVGKGNERYAHHDGYHHSMAALALAEAYGMTNDPTLKGPAQKSVDYSVKVHQVPYGGWRYEPGKSEDISHTGWFIMQLKSAKVAGLQVDGAAFQGGMNFVNKVLSPKSGRSVYYDGQANEVFKNGYIGDMKTPDRRTAISMVCRLFMGIPGNDEIMKLSARFPKAAPPKWEEEDFYYWYYATLASFQVGGDTWKVWNEALKPTLVDNQRKGGPLDGSDNDVDGSWDYEKDPYGKGVGRVYTTALGALSLEIYYRYLPMYTK